MDFDIIGQLLITYTGFVRYWRRNRLTLGQYISYLEISRRSMTQSGEKYCIYNSLIIFGIPMKLVS
jgi:hypothetical protein